MADKKKKKKENKVVRGAKNFMKTVVGRVLLGGKAKPVKKTGHGSYAQTKETYQKKIKKAIGE